jgi:hypothetical protein
MMGIDQSRFAVRCSRLALLAACAVSLMGSQAAPVQVRDIDGRLHAPFAAGGPANVLLFVTSDCPISNGYAPEIQRLCGEYGRRGISCLLVYEDVNVEAAAVRSHLAEYRYRGIPAVIDHDRTIARRAGASVTPQAVVIGTDAAIEYRGRIDNKYEELGRARRVITARELQDALDALLAGHPVARRETTALGCHIVSPDVLRKSP